MGSDISRSTFDPSKHYSGVRQQQGRVSVDADWNEQVDIVSHRVATETADIVGQSGAPRDNAGFYTQHFQPPTLAWGPATVYAQGTAIVDSNGNLEVAIVAGTSGATAPTWPTTVAGTVAEGSGLTWQLVQGDLSISSGRVYVDGLLCELNTVPVAIENFNGDGTGAAGTQVQVASVVVDGVALQPADWVQISAQGTPPPPALSVQVAVVNAGAGSLTFATSVNQFASFNNPQVQRIPTYATQPYYPSAPPVLGTGTSIVYLDVWEREITGLEDPGIQEIALGGADTATRTQVVWQVKLVDVSTVSIVSCSMQDSGISSWESVIQPSGGQLTTGVAQSQSPGPCSLTMNTGYTGVENQLYRVQIHNGGIYGWQPNTFYILGAEIIDSNGSLERAMNAGTSGASTPNPWATTVGGLTTDETVVWQLVATDQVPLWQQNTAYVVGNRVVDSDGNVQTAVASGTSGTTTPAWPSTVSTPVPDGTSGLVWQMSPTFKWSRDNGSVATSVTVISPAGSSGSSASQLTVLSTGRDDALSFSPGDWIELTDDYLELGGQAGELHQIAVGGVDPTAATITLQDAVSQAFQDRLSDPSTNYHPRIIRWDQGGTEQGGNVYQVGASGGSTVWLNLNGSTGDIPVPPPGTTLMLENGVTVSFGLNPAGGSFNVGDYWIFAARTADGSVESLNQAAPRGIQHHYSRLGIVNFSQQPWVSDCRTIFPPLAEAAIHVTAVTVSGVGPLLNDSSISIQSLESPSPPGTLPPAPSINITVDMPVDANSITQPNSSSSGSAQATCFVTVDLPTPSAAGTIMGFTPLILPASVTLDSTSLVIGWSTTSAVVNALDGQFSSSIPNLLAHLTLKGDFIWSRDNPDVHLDGDVVGIPYPDSSNPNIEHAGLKLPSGNGRGSSDFQMWFWLMPAPTVTVSTTVLAFSPTNVGTTSAAQSVTLNNGTQTALTFSVSVQGPYAVDQASISIPANSSASVNVTFTPTQSGVILGSVSFSLAGYNVPTVTLTGTGVSYLFTVSPASLSFANVAPGTTASQPVTLANAGTGTITISGVTHTASPSPFAFNPPAILESGASTGGSVTFSPTSTGTFSDTLTINSNAPAVSINVSGSSVSAVATVILSASPTVLAFGETLLGASSVTVTNSGSGSATVTASISGTDATSFAITANTCRSLAPGQQCVISVRFSPIGTGLKFAQLIIYGGASPVTVALSGTTVTKPTGGGKDEALSGAATPRLPIQEKAVQRVSSPGGVKPAQDQGSSGSGTRSAFIRPEERPSAGSQGPAKPAKEPPDIKKKKE